MYGCTDTLSMTLQKYVNPSNEAQQNMDIKTYDLNLRP